MKAFLKLLPELLIIALSFLFFSNSFSAAVSSDDALTVLMTHQFKFPEAIYCWEQNRGGSIVPLVGQLFYKVVHLSPVLASDVARFLILIFGFLSFRSFLKKKSSKILLALVFFLPPYAFIGFTKYSWGLMYSLIGMSLFVVDYCLKAKSNKQKIIGIAILLILTVLATWTMDQAYPIYIYLAFLFVFFHRKDKLKLQRYTLISFLVLTLCAFAIYILKETAVITTEYAYQVSSLNNFSEIFTALTKVVNDSYQTFKFQLGNNFYSLYSISLLLISIFTFWRFTRTSLPKKQKFILLGISILSLCIFLMVIFSHWVLLNYSSRRYYSGFYFLFISAILYYWDQTKPQNRKINWALSFILIIGFISTIFHYKYVAPKTLIPRTQQLQKLNELDGSIGIIGDYWYSYGLSFINPDKIIASPHDAAQIRNFEYTHKLFKQDHIYLVKNLWLDEFPNEIKQFGKLLQKVGEPIRVSEVELQEYHLKK